MGVGPRSAGAGGGVPTPSGSLMGSEPTPPREGATREGSTTCSQPPAAPARPSAAATTPPRCCRSRKPTRRAARRRFRVFIRSEILFRSIWSRNFDRWLASGDCWGDAVFVYRHFTWPLKRPKGHEHGCPSSDGGEAKNIVRLTWYIKDKSEYLNNQKLKPARIIEEIRKQSFEQNIITPSEATTVKLKLD